MQERGNWEKVEGNKKLDEVIPRNPHACTYTSNILTFSILMQAFKLKIVIN